MQISFTATVECEACDATEVYQEVGEPYDFEDFEFAEFEESADKHFRTNGFRRDTLLDSWYCLKHQEEKKENDK